MACPKWISEKTIGSHASILIEDAETGEVCRYIGGKDMDVSDYGEKWFHLIGPRCLSELPDLSRPQILSRL